MFSSLHFLKCAYWLVAVLFFTTLWGRVQAAPQGEYCRECNGSGVCKYNVQGYCIPNRRSYGYYHTTWRMWPEEKRKETSKRELGSEGLKGIRRTITPDSMQETGVAPPREKESAETPPQTNQQSPELQLEQQQHRQIDPFQDEPQQPSDEPNDDQSNLPTGPADRVTDFRPRNVLRQRPHTTGAVGTAAGTPGDNRVPRKTYGNVQQASTIIQLNLSTEGNTVSANPPRGRGSMSTAFTHSKTITDKLRTTANRGDTNWLPANNPLRAQ